MQCPNGDYTQYDNPKPCVAVLIMSEKGLLFGERAAAPKKGYWDVLGGFIDSYESAEETVRREILEETGLRVQGVQYLGSIPDVYAETGIPTLNLCYLAKVRGHPKAAGDVSKLKWFPLNALPKRLAFEHQKTLLVMFKRRIKEFVTGIPQGGLRERKAVNFLGERESS
jgi:ADP-ribose pyrophosphatase YjhB (NUDIX family)